ncbi:hypothetical protein [Streptomyces sp. NBC_01089]|uniref:hypothetical protein n=1 Tax=Streptomyces sp. NBC_01089 TaxID=2903747 RepID=UPI00386B869A|nr:hypothetical protein OG510_16050 [Streptomyces sp. NBC_01089]
MNANQQHMFDAYRAVQRGEAAPPLPGRHDWEAIGELRDHLRTGRPDRRRRRQERSRNGWLRKGRLRNGWLRRLLNRSRPTH